MEIRNAIIITDDDSLIHMRVDEMPNFTGNRIFNRQSLPNHVATYLCSFVDSSAKIDAALELEPDDG